ncbi:hypothetical protein ACFC0K_36290 [Streptomyces hydrogenans]|uniref:hypothetical protein n=1 Tax=Streptomyces hydrogenans TaxID=1873719 RepID=UPI0035DFA384
MTQTIARPSAGLIDEMEREDNRRGYEAEPESLAAFHQLVRYLRLDGDRRATAAGRLARRTFAQMTGGTHTVKAADDACGLCGFWTCRCSEVLGESRWTR